MKIFRGLILIVLMFLQSCEKTILKHDLNSKKIKVNKIVEQNNNFPYTSENVKKYYKLDSDSIGYVIDTAYKGLLVNNFGEEVNTVPIKENDFDIQPKTEDKYYVLQTFNLSSENLCKLIIYNSFGENDSKVLNVQLNSYWNNHLIDQILLDCRFTFETEYFRKFSIDKDKSIKIEKYSVNKLQYNEAGDIVGEKQIADSNLVKVDYKIDNLGKFIKK